jgi:hypothetical protein
MEQVTGEWRKLSDEESCDLCSPPDDVQVIKSRTMRWARQVARMVGNVNTEVLCGNLTERDILVDLVLEGLE